MVILAFDHIGIVWVVRCESRNVEKETIRHINESSIDDVGSVTSNSFPRPRIDVEQVSSGEVHVSAVVLVVGMIVGLR